MSDNNVTPAGENPPAYISKGPPGYEGLNDWFRYLLSMVYLPADSSIIATPGTATSPGRIRATAQGGGGTTAATPPFSIVSAVDDAHPARVRVYAGTLGGILPDEMNLPDAVLPDGTDERCYLTMQSGDNYVYGKVLVDATTGTFSAAHVYSVSSSEEADGTYAYLPLGYVNLADDGTLSIDQQNTGNKSLFVYPSPDGTLLFPIWTS